MGVLGARTHGGAERVNSVGLGSATDASVDEGRGAGPGAGAGAAHVSAGDGRVRSSV